jgi:sugar/nucleoside kinase (ribokinase family)
MTGALAAALAQGTGWLDAVVVGMAAGAAHYSGRGETSRAVIETLAAEVSRRSVPM